MHVCGRALFREVARRWQAGEMQYDEVLWHHKPVSEEELGAHSHFADVVLQQQGTIEKACLIQKVHHKTNFCRDSALRLEILVFLCNLAEKMGYYNVLDALEMVWGRAVAERDIKLLQFSSSGGYEVISSVLQADFEGGRRRSLDAPEFFSEFRIMGYGRAGANMSYGIQYSGMELLRQEILGAFWLVAFPIDVGMYARNNRSFLHKVFGVID